MSLLTNFKEYIRDKNLFQKEDRLVVAVSGGIDSVSLCELCRQAGLNFEMAHGNFQLRGEESARDEYFVKSLAEHYRAWFHMKRFDTEKYAEEQKISVQVAARELRYQWFNELINREPGNHQSFILTAHHANDNIETLLINFFKGTGIRGLHGIVPKQNHIVRPLLFAKREEIELFAKAHNLPFVEDSSNLTDKYTRNYVRHKVIPAMQQVFPKAEENLLDNIERFNDIELLYNQSIDFYRKKLLEFHKNEVHIPVLKLLKSKPLATIVFEIIKDYGFTSHQTHEVIHLLNTGSGKYVSSHTHKIIKNRKWIIISPLGTRESSNIIIEKTESRIEFEKGVLAVKNFLNKDISINTSPAAAMLDAANITFPLLLRKWKQGDYFYPIGMQKKKKLSRFFIDQKLSIPEKENTWIVESNKRILWVINHRIDDRFKITSKTKNILQFTFKEQ